MWPRIKFVLLAVWCGVRWAAHLALAYLCRAEFVLSLGTGQCNRVPSGCYGRGDGFGLSTVKAPCFSGEISYNHLVPDTPVRVHSNFMVVAERHYGRRPVDAHFQWAERLRQSYFYRR